MFGFGKRPRKTALDELKERLSLPEIKHAEAVVVDFYSGRNPYAHLKTEWPQPYAQFVRGFAYALDRCKKDGITIWEKQENIASMCGLGMARATFKPTQEAA
jgi:hypothetical protein